MGVEDVFTGGRSPEEWQSWIYDVSRQKAARVGVPLPDWVSFQREGWVKILAPDKPTIMLEAFRAGPETDPLATPSGKIEIHSETAASFTYDDCPGHPVWLEPLEWLGRAEPGHLHMISNQPRNRLHSQFDHGTVSRADRVEGREPVPMHPNDAAARNLTDGQIVQLHNSRGTTSSGLSFP